MSNPTSKTSTAQKTSASSYKSSEQMSIPFSQTNSWTNGNNAFTIYNRHLNINNFLNSYYYHSIDERVYGFCFGIFHWN